MSGADPEPPVGASAGSSSAAVPPAPEQQQQQEINAAQLFDAIREIIRQRQQQQQQPSFLQQEMAAARSRSHELRGWLMVVATLTASITYNAALNPPGGVWQADDPAKGYVAGTPVLLDKSKAQYLAFYYFNITSFATSLCIIVLSSTPSFYNSSQTALLHNLVAIDLFALAVAFFAGSWTTPKKRSAYSLIIVMSLVEAFIVVIFLWLHYRRRLGTVPPYRP